MTRFFSYNSFLTVWVLFSLTSLGFAVESSQRPDGTLGFTSYLGALIDQRIIGDTELASLIEVLEKGRVINPIARLTSPYGSLFTRSSDEVHYAGLQAYIDRSELNFKKVLEWAESHLVESGRVKERRERARVETQDIFQRIRFNRVEHTYPFEMMSTPITQKHWSLVMGENPSKFALGANTIVLNIQGKSIYMQPDNPVENISWKDAANFIQKLNVLSASADPILKELIADHHPGDRFQFPTEGQWDVVSTLHGTTKGAYFFGDDPAELKKYAWFLENSGGTTHPVAELCPLVIDGVEFFDILGNVWEWTSDRQEVPGDMESCSPCMEKFMKYRIQYEYILKGGRARSSAESMRSGFSVTALPEQRDEGYGLRLVRLQKTGQ